MELKKDDRSSEGIGEARLVELKSGRPGPCLFLVPGTGGRVEGFAELASLLNTPMSVFAIEARGIIGNAQPDDDIDALVTHYIERIQILQPDGPYFLLGHSFGGMVVFEMAQRLLGMQERVARLLLLDTVVPKRFWPLRAHVTNFTSRVHGHLKRIARDPLKDNLNYYTRRITLRRRGLQDIPEDMMFGRDGARMLLANEMLMKKWSPGFYPGRLTLFCAHGTHDLDKIWQSRVSELQIYPSKGDHIALIEQPYVQSLARDISTCLAKE